MTSTEQTPDESHGQPAFIGFDYQILVTVWLALEFIVRRGSPEIVVEPPSEEDIAAELRGEEPATEVAIQSFQIQIKLLSNALWTATELTKLVAERIKKGKPGPAPRPRAFQYLADRPAEHYILVTTAGVSAELNPHCITEVGQKSHADGFNGLSVNPDIAGRIGILPNETPPNVRLRIISLLQKYCHVPGDAIDRCISNLALSVSERLAGRKPNVFKREELERLLSASRGEILSAVEPTYPENIEKIRERLAKDNVVILIGPPGTGKSTIARLLVDEFRLGDPPAKLHTIKEREHLNLVHETINAAHSHVYFVEDPWGQGILDDKARFFTTELAPLLQQARAGKTFIVTTRLGPYREAIEDRPDYSKWELILDEKSYSAVAYREIYERQLGDWKESHRVNALDVRDAVLKHLETPYAVNFFCGLLKVEVCKGWVNEQEATKLARESNVQVFGKRLRERVIDAGRSEIIPAIAIWAQLTANDDFISHGNAKHLRRLLTEGQLNDVPDVELFFNYLTTSRWLQRREGGFVVTPSVKEALQSLSDRPANFEDTLTALIRSWSARSEFQSILLCLREAKWDGCLVPEDAAPPFDSYLVSLAVDADARNFIYVFRELAGYSSTNNPVAELARALRVKRDGSKPRFKPMNFPRWTRTDLAAESVKQIAGEPDCAICAKKFVVDYLPDGISHSFFGESYPRGELLAFLRQFDWPLIDWFQAALADVLEYPRESTSYLFECMLELAPAKIDELIEDAVLALRNCRLERDPRAEEEWRQYSEGETNADRYGPENEDDAPFYISKALTAGVVRKSEERGHTWIPGHVYEAELFYAWTSSIDTETSLSEKQDFVLLCEKYDRTDSAAGIVLKTPDSSFHGWAVRTLLSPNFKIDGTARLALLNFAKSREFLDLLQSESGQQFESGMALLAFLALKEDAGSEDDKAPSTASTDPFSELENLAELLTEMQKGALIACRNQMRQQASITEIEIDLEFLSLLAREWPEIPAIDALETIAANGGVLDPLIERFLGSDDSKIRLRAWALCESRSRHLQEALLDPHYGCRNAALDFLSIDPSPDELTAILSRVNDPSAYVRECLAKQLGEKGRREGIPVLIKLLSDKRDYADHNEYGEGRIHIVARTACDSLRRLAPLEEETIAILRPFLESCESSSTDPVVHEKLFGILEEHPCSTNTEFCSRYLDTIWLGSKWNTLGGRGIVHCCLRAVCAHFGHDPSLANNFDFTRTIEIAEWNNDELGIVAFSLAALALGYDAGFVDLSPVLALESFSSQRSRLLASFSRRLRTEKPPDLMKHLSDEHSFLSFLGWADNSDGVTFSDFSAANLDFQPWLASLESGNDFEKLLYEAASRLISSANPSA